MLEFVEVMYSPDAWSRPGDSRRPYRFTVRVAVANGRAVDREGAPTPEQLARGGYERPEGEAARGGLAVYTNTNQNVIGRLRGIGAITKNQAAAAYCFERTWCVVHGGVSPSRDSTVPGVGGTIHETDEQIKRIGKADGRLKLILQSLGPRLYSLLVSACCFGEGEANDEFCSYLRHALDYCSKVYGIGKDDEDSGS